MTHMRVSFNQIQSSKVKSQKEEHYLANATKKRADAVIIAGPIPIKKAQYHPIAIGPGPWCR